MRPSELSRRDFFRLVSLVPAVLAFSRVSDRSLVRRSTLTMGGLLDLQILTQYPDHAHRVAQRVFAEFYRVDELLSVYRPQSLISRINRQAGRAEVEAPTEVSTILSMASEFHRETRGGFNILVEPLMRVYGFRGASASISDKAILEAIRAAHPANLVVNRRSVGLLHPLAAIDLGGIGVGYALDRCIDILRSEDIDNALLNHSGDIVAIGGGPDGNGWPVAIRDPIHTDRTSMTLELCDAAISTSGNYEKRSSVAGASIGHILLTENGMNPDFYLSLSVVADKAIAADALSTGFFCRGELPSELRCVAIVPDNGGFTVLDRI